MADDQTFHKVVISAFRLVRIGNLTFYVFEFLHTVNGFDFMTPVASGVEEIREMTPILLDAARQGEPIFVRFEPAKFDVDGKPVAGVRELRVELSN